ncbi:MAG TPA: hypothetical protein VHA13_01810 [Gammaproteobacteria bacterium]|nr:hypothetical protein [Gammaproteobacteria bacterium]
MSRTRSQSIPANEHSTLKHWVYCMGKGQMKQQAEDWIEDRNFVFGEDFHLIERNKGKLFSQVENDSILHIYGHGNPDKIVIYKGEEELGPKEFLNFLKAEGLSEKHTALELDACFSDVFARELANIAQKDYPQLFIIGFPKQFVLCQGNNNENLANLDEPFVTLTNQGSIINQEEFNKHPKNKKDEFIASNHKKIFYTNPTNQIEESLTNASDEKESNITSSRRITRSTSVTTASFTSLHVDNDNKEKNAPFTSKYGRGYIFRKPEDQPKARESLPGRSSWAEIIRQDTKSIENKDLTEHEINLTNIRDLTLEQDSTQQVQGSDNNGNIAENNDSPNSIKPK